MGYWTLKQDYLLYVSREWKNYYNERIRALNYLYDHGERSYRNEGNDDLYYERYNAPSVQRWYDDKIRDLNRWYDDAIQELKAEDRRFQELFKQMCNDYYTSNDFHYKITYNYYKFTRVREYNPDGDSQHFRVKVTGQTHWYSCRGERRDMEFSTGTPELEYHE